MRNAIIILAAAGVTASAWATDLNPVGGNICGAGAIITDPSQATGESGFKKLYENLTVMMGDGEMWKINTDDTTWWESGDIVDPNRNYTYLMIKFVKPQGYQTGTLNWCVRVTGGADVYAYR